MGDRPLIAGVPPDLADHLGFLLSKLGTATRRHFAEALSVIGITARQFAVLMALGAREGLSQHALGERLRIDPSSMVTVIDDCEAAGLAERRPDPKDRRRRAVHLTDAGRSRLAEAQQVARRVNAELFAPLDETQRAHLHQLLTTLATTGPLSSLGSDPPGHEESK